MSFEELGVLSLAEPAVEEAPAPSPRHAPGDVRRVLVVACLATLALLGLMRLSAAAALYLESDEARFYYSYRLHRASKVAATSTTFVAERLRDAFPGLEVRLGENDVIFLRGPRRAFDFARQSDILTQLGYDPHVRGQYRPYPLRDAVELPEQPWRELPLLLSGCAALFAAGWVGRRLTGSSLPWSTGPAALAFVVGSAVTLALWTADGLLLGLLAVFDWPVLGALWLEDAAAAGGQTFAATALWIVVLGPIGEEYFFRGWLLPLLEERAGATVALVGSSLLFALYHQYPAGIPVYFVDGLVFAETARRSNGLLIPIVAHAALNALVMVT